MITDETILEVFAKVRDHYGLSKYYDYYPELEICEETHWLSGEFRSDYCGIVVYPLAIINEEELIRTIVHEYQHYLQDPDEMERLNEKHDYYSHPFEIEAYAIEDRDYQLFMA